VLLILTVVLMLAALVLLILGLADDTLSYIYGCIACSAAALLLLLAFGRLSRRREVRLAASSGPTGAFAPPEPTSAPSNPSVLTATPVVPPVGPAGLASVPLAEATGTEATGTEATGTGTGGAVAGAPSAGSPAAVVVSDSSIDGPDESDQVGVQDDVVFPIADYDDLPVREILPLLADLEPDELEDVRAHEMAGKCRVSILRRLDVLVGRAGSGLAEPAEVEPAEAEPAETEPGGEVKAAAKTPTVAKRTPAAKKVPVAKKAPGAPKARGVERAGESPTGAAPGAVTPVAGAVAAYKPPTPDPQEPEAPSVVGARRRPLPPRTAPPS
jgi:hypothetical protein